MQCRPYRVLVLTSAYQRTGRLVCGSAAGNAMQLVGRGAGKDRPPEVMVPVCGRTRFRSLVLRAGRPRPDACFEMTLDMFAARQSSLVNRQSPIANPAASSLDDDKTKAERLRKASRTCAQRWRVRNEMEIDGASLHAGKRWHRYRTRAY